MKIRQIPDDEFDAIYESSDRATRRRLMAQERAEDNAPRQRHTGRVVAAHVVLALCTLFIITLRLMRLAIDACLLVVTSLRLTVTEALNTMPDKELEHGNEDGS